ncbi:sugar transferase [Thalassoglobus polymorphus]|uniref:UDP-N-acetylgalactosamine-undecaprenyl-phosphate N-acetylgalactosaminephosphotransferase n=1 Tax=Thalassoglobus polymorphus TaxID=2527994 RepID=A0A517QRG1_9PLAN|nr:sugar transferase [Thalassoglobus polymorphus]QDT34216.1 UDP-N-acetylgalactosamine-undecaprenyl-phosphate N-acetylgalactosaminephosphotransferase [Thalassoglobus polymorphus]
MSSQAVLPPSPSPANSSKSQNLPTPTDKNPLQDIIELAGIDELPDVWWVTDLKNESPRIDVRCLSESTRLGKRLLDLFVSATLLVLLLPVMIIVGVLVKLTSPGPMIFKQVRVGLNLRRTGSDRRKLSDEESSTEDRRNAPSDRRVKFAYGQHFTIYKFRTMRNDAEKNGAQFAVQGDARITGIGKFLRKTRLDELPQLINVLRGEMSLVGPRPERPEFMAELSEEIPYYLDRLGLKPGLTGVAQIINGYDNEIDSFRRKAAFDLYYLQNCSVWNDFKILVRTVKVVLSGSGAL